MRVKPTLIITLIAAVGGFAALYASHALSKDTVYRWTDERGRVHYAAQPPHDRRLKTVLVETDGAAPRGARNGMTPSHVPTTALTTSLRAAHAPTISSNPSTLAVVTSLTSLSDAGLSACQRSWKRFEESQACFERYRLVNGAVRDVAFDHCTELKQPTCHGH